MAGRNPQTHAKRARELAVKERRERKRAKKAEAAARRASGAEAPTPEHDIDESPTGDDESPAEDVRGEQTAPPASDWIQ
jgi:hypothetical protein